MSANPVPPVMSYYQRPCLLMRYLHSPNTAALAPLILSTRAAFPISLCGVVKPWTKQVAHPADLPPPYGT